MTMPDQLTIAFSEVRHGPDGIQVRVRTGRVMLVTLLVTLVLGTVLVACASTPEERPSPPP